MFPSRRWIIGQTIASTTFWALPQEIGFSSTLNTAVIYSAQLGASKPYQLGNDVTVHEVQGHYEIALNVCTDGCYIPDESYSFVIGLGLYVSTITPGNSTPDLTLNPLSPIDICSSNWLWYDQATFSVQVQKGEGDIGLITVYPSTRTRFFPRIPRVELGLGSGLFSAFATAPVCPALGMEDAGFNLFDFTRYSVEMCG
jgi:hypothetical protein